MNCIRLFKKLKKYRLEITRGKKKLPDKGIESVVSIMIGFLYN